MIKVIKSKDVSFRPKLNILVYGEPGVGKTTFGTTAPNPILADCEEGSNFLGIRGLELDIVKIKEWKDLAEFYALVKDSKYETVILDPANELLEKLIVDLKEDGGLKTRNGALTLQGWGIAKDRMKNMFRTFRDMEKNVIVVAHADEPKDDERTIRRPRIQANLASDLSAMMDIVGYLKVEKIGSKYEHRLYVQPTEVYHAKDRSGCLPDYLAPDWKTIYKQIVKNPIVKQQMKIEQTNAKTDKKFNDDLEKSNHKKGK